MKTYVLIKKEDWDSIQDFIDSVSAVLCEASNSARYADKQALDDTFKAFEKLPEQIKSKEFNVKNDKMLL